MINRTGDRGGRKDEPVARPWDSQPGADYYPQPSSIRDQAEEVLNLLMRRKWIVLVICVLIVGGAAYHTFSQTPIYESTGLVMISDRGQGQAGPQRDGQEVDLFARSNRSMENELLILRNSGSLRTAVAERLLEQDVLPGTDRPIPVTRAADGSTRGANEIAPRLGGMVSFGTAGRDARVIQMTGRSSEPREAALVANFFMEEYVDLTRRSSRANMRATREFLEEQVDERYAELDNVETRIQEYMRQEGAVALDNEGARLVNRLAEAEANLDVAEIQRSQRVAQIESMQEELNSISPRLAERIASGVEQEIQAIQQNITEAEQARQELRERGDALTPNEERRLQQLGDRIDRYRAEARDLSENYVDEVLGVGGVGLGPGQGLTHVTQLQRNIVDEQIALSGLDAETALYRERITRFEADLETIPAQAREMASLEREQTYLEGVYRNLVEQLQDVRMREQTELGYADRVNEAFVPGRPSSPDVQRNLMLAVLMGLLLGVGGAFLRDRMDSRLYKPEQVRASGYRLLTVVPDLTPFRKEHFNGAEEVTYKNHQISSSVVTALTPSAAPAEAYRHLRTNLQFARPDEMLEVMMVTSPGMGDGKSVSAANLAVALAQAGNRTLLLDADLRRPQVHKLFGMDRTPGLSNHLRDGADSALALQRTVEPHLYALPAGDPVGNPSELLGSPAFRNVLAALREHFEYIVIDTPPVLVATDATLLSTQCDGTIMVTRAAVTTEPELEESLATLEDVGTTVDGIVFNAFKVSMAFGYKLRYRHYATYGHYGQYSQESASDDTDEPQVIRV